LLLRCWVDSSRPEQAFFLLLNEAAARATARANPIHAATAINTQPLAEAVPCDSLQNAVATNVQKAIIGAAHQTQAAGVWITVVAGLCLAVENARAPTTQAAGTHWRAAVPEAEGPFGTEAATVVVLLVELLVARVVLVLHGRLWRWLVVLCRHCGGYER